MVNDSLFKTAVDVVRKQNDVGDDYIKAATMLLNVPGMCKSPITMVVEFQVCAFFEVRHCVDFVFVTYLCWSLFFV